MRKLSLELPPQIFQPWSVNVVNNLKRLASQSDVFDSAIIPDGPGEGADPEEDTRRKRMAPVGPAGVPSNPQAMNIQEQIRQIYERYERYGNSNNSRYY